MKTGLALAGVALSLAAAWAAWPDVGATAAMPDAARAPVASQPVSHDPRGPGLAWLSQVPGAQPEHGVVRGWASLADGREKGDSRTPPLNVPIATDSAPSAAQLADPAAYRSYEQNQHARTLAAFAVAAEAKAASLRADVARARAAGISEAEIVKVEQKIRRLDEVRRGIVAGGKVPPG